MHIIRGKQREERSKNDEKMLENNNRVRIHEFALSRIFRIAQ